MSPTASAPPPPAGASIPPAVGRWAALRDGLLRAFHRYANWLVGITWLRFFLLSVLLLIITGILQNIPPFSTRWTVGEVVEAPRRPARPPAPGASKEPAIRIERPASAAPGEEGVDIRIGERGIRITPRRADVPGPAASGAGAAASAAPAVPPSPAPPPAPAPGDTDVRIELPPGADREAVRQAVEEARQAIREAIREQQEAAREAAREAGDVVLDMPGVPVIRKRTTSLGEFLPELAMLWIVASAMVKITYKGRLKAEEKAAQATETAEAEQLRRQVAEARMAAMQAQIEPHFLFNTLASIDHLIETDPPRASQMQKNLIALLRASMPTLRETSGTSPARDLGRELAVIRPYLEILKVRMEERLATRIEVPAGLLSAEFPPMMIQTLVENAIQHGLEPKPEGGELVVRAEIVHGKLAVSVTDTGLGFGRAPTAGTGVGLANIRERLQMLYGGRASLTVADHPPGGTVVTITVPYRSLEGQA